MFFALKIYLTSVRYWVFPVGLATDQGWTPHMETAEGLLLIAGAVSLVGATVFLMRADRKLGMCLAWFLAAVLPAGILPFISGLTLYQDHRVYLAGVAFAWAAGWLLWRISRLRPQTRLMGVLGVAGLTVCVVTIVWVDRGRTAVWSDSLRLWDDVLSKHPASFIAHSSRGEALLRAGRLREARQALERAIQLAPGYPTPHNNLGVLLLREGDAANAALEFERAISLKPGYSTAALNLADAYRRLERVDAALTVYDGLSKQYPDWPEPLIRSASLLKSLGRLDGAIDRYRRAVGKHPERDDAVLRLGATLLLANRWAEARDVFTAFRSRHPRSYPAQYCIGLTYAREGDDDRALIEWRKALSLDASHPDLPFELGLLHARRGQWADAAAWHEHALRIDPGHRLAHLNFAVAAVLTGRPEIAAVHFKAFQTATDRLQLERRHDARSTPSEGFFPDTIGF
jgi:tetratricopeptide (TPR) repeat protein